MQSLKSKAQKLEEAKTVGRAHNHSVIGHSHRAPVRAQSHTILAGRAVRPATRQTPVTPADRPAWVNAARLTLYASPPTSEVALETFERSAIDRLRVLKGIEDEMSRGAKPQEMQHKIKELENKYLSLVDPATNKPNPEGELKDVVSHFVLRLAYCRTEELRRWFLTQECQLFRHRFRALPSVAQAQFLVDHNLPYQILLASEQEAIATQLDQTLKASNGSAAAVDSRSVRWYRVPFEEVPDLVRNRKVFLVRGEAYVPQENLASLVVGVFRARVSKALALTARQWAAKIAPMELDRLTPIVEALSTRHLGTVDYSQGSATGTVTAADLPRLAQQSFPLCMQQLMQRLKDDHHLRHFGRMQLGLFFKGIGLSLEDAMAFWRSEFLKGMPSEKFEKQYAYNIRHNYGKEGKRQDYTPYSCMKIIMSTPGHGDAHGCPYKHWSEDGVRAALRKMNLNSKTVDEVLEKKRSHHYQLACVSAFEGVHGCACDSGINHPNQYFEESRKVLDGGAAGSPSSAPVTPVTPAATVGGGGHALPGSAATPGVPMMAPLGVA